MDVLQLYLQKVESIPDKFLSGSEDSHASDLAPEDYYRARLLQLAPEWRATDALRLMQNTLYPASLRLRNHLLEAHQMDDATQEQLNGLFSRLERMTKLIEVVLELDIEQRSRQLLQQLEEQERKP
jgi:hypothetical protein